METDPWVWGEQDMVPDDEMESLGELVQYVKEATAGKPDLILLNQAVGGDEGSGEITDDTLDVIVENLNDWRLVNVNDLKNPMLISLSNWLVKHAMPAEISWTEIKKSTIQGAGYGLFATKDVPSAGVYLTVYGGDLYGSKRHYARDTDDFFVENNHYVINLKDSTKLLDGKVGFYLREQGRWANGQFTEEECNAQFHEIVEPTLERFWHMRIESTRPIKAGEEIFVWYGESYVEQMRKMLHSKKLKIEQCIQCQVREATDELLGFPHLIFCGQKCAAKFWNGYKGRRVMETF